MHQSQESTKSRVLLAEDCDFNQDIAIELLSKMDIEVDVANNGKEAVEKLRNHGANYYAMILMDLEMPVLDGPGATIEIRKNPQFDQIPIIALTAHNKDGIQEHCFNVGMQGFLGKPFDPNSLHKIVNEWLPATSSGLTSNNQTQQSSTAWISQIEGIDPRQALHSVSQNTQLLKQLLQRYSISQRKTVGQIESTSISHPISENFIRLIHTLKGSSATIGALKLADLTSNIEMQLKQFDIDKNSTMLELSLTKLRQELVTLLDRLDNFFANDELVLPTTQNLIVEQFDGGEIQAQLMELLQMNDPEALRFFEENQRNFKRIFQQTQFQELEKSLFSYDFDKASQLIQENQ